MDAQIAALAVAEKGSFEAAGRYIGIGKSAVRKRVQKLESELGTRLFRAVGKGMMPTEAGSVYIMAARESVRNALIAVDRVHAFLRAHTNNLHIGYSSYLNFRLLEVVRRIRPGGINPVSVTRESMTTEQAVAGVVQGNLHIGFGFLPILETGVSSRALFEEPLVACLPAGHRLAMKSTIHAEHLEGEPVVSVCSKGLPGIHQEIVTHFESLGVSLRFVENAYSVQEALWLVAQGVGISLMTRSAVSSHRQELIVRPLSDRLLRMKSGLFTRNDHDQEVVRNFVDLAWAETAALRAGPH